MENEENDKKRIKLETNNVLQEECISTSPVVKVEQCSLCKQYSNSVLYYSGHPNYSCEEQIALKDERLNLCPGQEEFVSDNDIQTHKVTYFTVYDKNGHLCPFDTGLIDNNVHLYFSGYIKQLCDEDPNADNGVPARDMGPIEEWWMTGYDGNEKLCVGFTTSIANYYLMKPSNEYEPVYCKIGEKTKIAKLVVEFLLDRAYENPRYEDLIEHLEFVGEYKNVVDILIQNAQFICDQIINIDNNASEYDLPLFTISCIRSLVKIAGISFKRHSKLKPFKDSKETKSTLMSTAVTTKLVKDVFEQFFSEQIEASKGPKKLRCGICKNCQNSDCGKCTQCLDMKKFGGFGRLKQACQLRRCMQMAIEDAELPKNEETNPNQVDKQESLHVSEKGIHDVTWGDPSEYQYKGNQCYLSSKINNFTVSVGDYVTVKSENEEEPLSIAKIVYMFDKLPQKYLFHGHLFCRGIDTILGKTADPRELFVVDDCEELFLGSVVRKAKVEFRRIPENWSTLGGELHLQEPLEDDGETFFFTKRLENNRFVDLDFDEEKKIEGCDSCRRNNLKDELNTPTLVGNCVKWKNEDYKIGTGVLLEPDAYTFENENNENQGRPDNEEKNVDENIYPEYYRKNSENIKSSNKDKPKPFIVGIIECIFEKENKDVEIKVKIFFRPENTYPSVVSGYAKDLNYLYYTDEVTTLPFEKVAGKCNLTFGYNFTDPAEWSERGPYRFYFIEAYDPQNHCLKNLPTHVKNIGIASKGKGKAKDKQQSLDLAPKWPTIHSPLRCMSIFSGCGGLSEGLKQCNLIISRWAIEKEAAAANTFRLNNPDCKIFNSDCNFLLKCILNNPDNELGLPEKGDVEILVGGPPNQGFLEMNRFYSRNYSTFKNSLVVSYLSYCEYYRPKYFILDNIRNFVSFKKSMFLKLTIRCLLAIGYQVTYGILQSGQYGVPQTQPRFILMAAAPGYILPTYPEPMNVFSRKGLHLSFVVDGCSYSNECYWTESAPYRMITVRDAISDLPDIQNGAMKLKIPYTSEPVTHYQRKMRGADASNFLWDHMCKEMSLLVEARISHIPSYAGSDWRDLPNISLRLRDGTETKLLEYPYRTETQKPDDRPRGVCHCALTNGVCDPGDKQVNTLIPWCLPHTGDRHNNWSGLYGRLEWDNHFGTTITDPEPMGKQGKVLHPVQNRVVGVRECARSQGFPDNFRFSGSIMDKYRQIGNAVPPPLGFAIGKQIVKAVSEMKEGE